MSRRKSITTDSASEYLTVDAVAALLNISNKVVYRLIAGGALTAYRFASAIRIKRADFEKYRDTCKIRHVGRPLTRYEEGSVLH